MEFVRKAVLVLVTPLFVILLFATASNTATLTVATSPDKIKSVIAKSSIYETVIPGLLEEAGQISSGGDEVSLNNDIVREAAEKTFTPQFIQQNTEVVIDSIYNWLNGETPVPDFQIDLIATKATFAANVADAVEKKLASLPACPAGTSVPENLDPLAVTCLPSGLNPASEAAAIEQNIISGTGFLDHPVITADTLKSEGDPSSLFNDQLKQVPEVYQKLKAIPIITGILALMLALAIILLSSSKRKGLRRVGIVLVVVGIILLAVAYDLARIVGEALEHLNLDNKVLEDKARALVLELAKEVGKLYWIFGGVYTALGASATAWTIYKKPKGGKADDDDLEGEGKTPEDRINLKDPDDVTPLAKTPDTTAAKPKPKPRPAPKKTTKKIIIQ